MAYIPKEIVCENCLESIEFESDDVFSDNNSFFITCSYCSNDIELYDLEDFGINPSHVKKLHNPERPTSRHGEHTSSEDMDDWDNDDRWEDEDW